MINPMQDQLQSAIAGDLGISDLKPEEQQALISQFGEVALKAATIAIVEKLGADKQEEFGKLAEAGDPLALQTFLNEHLPNHEEVAKAAVAEEVKRFRAFQAP